MPETVALLIGCGTIGRSTARLMVEDPRFHRIIVADRDIHRASELSEMLGDRVAAVQLDCHQEDQVTAALSGVSVVLNTTGPFNRDTLSLMRTVVEAGVPYADINDDVAALQSVFESDYLNSLAKHRGVGVLPGLGASPGQTNVMAGHLASRLDAVEEVRFFMVNDSSYRSEAVWRHRLALFGQPALLYDNGRWTETPEMSEYQDVEFPAPWGNIRCYAVGLETVTIPQSIPGLRHASLWRGFSQSATTEMLKTLVDNGFASERLLNVDGVSLSPAGMSAAVLAGPQMGDGSAEPARLPRQVRVKGMRAGHPTELTMTYSFPPGDVALATASCLVVGARLLVSRELPGPGVMPPEALDPAPFMWDMESRGVHFKLEDSASTRIWPLR
ncbi:MAG: saccharopine dehydrogenase NADP-binding domain-containing protein [Chloroflexi bacterium]|nr:saccharopine dehydrogenase NADP-binding domain-containing protein [Chloroflexota bacterium]